MKTIIVNYMKNFTNLKLRFVCQQQLILIYLLNFYSTIERRVFFPAIFFLILSLHEVPATVSAFIPRIQIRKLPTHGKIKSLRAFKLLLPVYTCPDFIKFLTAVSLLHYCDFSAEIKLLLIKRYKKKREEKKTSSTSRKGVN